MFHRFLLSLTVLLTPFAVRSEEKPKPVDPKAIQKFVEQLGSDDFDTRENAAKSLLDADEAALPALKEAKKSTDADVRQKAGELAATITVRVEERAEQKILAEVNREGLEKFIERLAKEKDFATEERWQGIAHLAAAIEKRAGEVADRSFRVTKLDLAKMTTLRAMPETDANTARLLLNSDTNSITGLYNCVVVSNGSIGRVGTFTNCIVIVKGDIDGFNIMRNCVVLCHGSIGRTRQIDSCVVLVTGSLNSTDTIHGSLIEINSVGRCTKSINSVYLNHTQSPAFTSTDDTCLQTKRGPLQMFNWTPPEPKK